MDNFDNYTDNDLLIFLTENDEIAFREIYKRYWYKLYVYANKRLRSKEASEEVIQNFFTKFWLNRNTLHIKGLFEAYLFTAIRYSIIDYLEKEATRNNYHELAYLNFQAIDNSTEEEVLLHDLTVTIENEVSRLPVKCRSVFLLSRNEHKTNKEIAHQLGISEKTVENHITNALKLLRLTLKSSIYLTIITVHHFFK